MPEQQDIQQQDQNNNIDQNNIGQGSVDVISQDKHNELLKQIEEKSKLIEDIKNSQRGVDQQNAALKKQLEEIKEKYLKEEQRAELLKREEEQKRQEIFNAASEKELKIKELEKEVLRNTFFIDNKVDPELKSFLTADSNEGLQEQLEKFNSIIEKNVSEGIKKVIGQTAPQRGESGRPAQSILGSTPKETLKNLR